MAKKAKKRKYSKRSGSDVKSEMHRFKKGTAKSGPGRQGRQSQKQETGHRDRIVQGSQEGQESPQEKVIEAGRAHTTGRSRAPGPCSAVPKRRGPLTERFVLSGVPTFGKNARVPMMIYPWPLNVDGVLNEALEIAMYYLEVTGRADAFFQTQAIAASAILNAWRAGARHKIRLANRAIAAVEKKVEPVAGKPRSQSFYPRVG